MHSGQTITEFIDELLTYDTEYTLLDELNIDGSVLNRAVEEVMSARPARHEPADLQHKWLKKLLMANNSRTWLAEVINSSAEDAFTQALSYPAHLTQSNYDMMAALIEQHAANVTTHTHLLARMASLARAAAHLIAFQPSLSVAHQLFSHGLVWLNHPAAQEHFVQISEEHTELAQHIHLINLNIKKCINGQAGSVVNRFALAMIFGQLSTESHANNIELLQKGLLLSEADYPEQWAFLQVTLGDALLKSSSGDRTENAERAIQAYEQGQFVFTYEQYPEEWANVQNNIGYAYLHRLRGERAENIETAIQALNRALDVRTYELFPEGWASTQTNFGVAYGDRIHGERLENLAKSIESFELALSVYTRERHPREWGATKYNQGLAYQLRQHELRVRDEEADIRAFELALEVRTREQYPKQWADTKAHLGQAYIARLQGEQAENVELAIAAYNQALAEYTPEHEPEQWAKTHHNLGNAFMQRLREGRADNVKAAIEAYKQALVIHTRERYPHKWADTQMSLGIAYRYRQEGELATNIEDAIRAFKLAGEVFTREQDPPNWARTQNNLGSAYAERLHGKPLSNLERAIHANKAALIIYTRQQYPEGWAHTQHNLGTVYSKRIHGNRAENVTLAIEAYRLALQVRTRDRFTQDYLDTAGSLGALFHKEGRWVEGRSILTEAHEALDLIRTETVREESRRHLAEKNAGLYNTLVHCCLQSGDCEAAVAYAMMNKSRSLTELLAGQRESFDTLLAQIPELATEWAPIQASKNELDNLLAFLCQPPSGKVSLSWEEQESEAAEGWRHAAALRQTISRRTDTLLFRYPALAAIQPMRSFSAVQARELSRQLGNVSLIEYVVHMGGYGAFIITSTAVNYVFLDSHGLDLVIDNLSDIVNENFWEEKVGGGQRLRDCTADLQKFHRLLFAPIEQYLPATGPLVVAPTSALHLVPFQALLGEDGVYLSEKYALSFVPSLATLQALHDQRQRIESGEQLPAGQRLLNVVYPGAGEDYLEGALPEARAVSTHFREVVGLLGDDALPERVFEAVAEPFEVLHLICHGSFDFENPLDSALLLAQDRRLTVNDIRLRLRLQGRPLVTLSACQTGQTDLARADESNGLSRAFLAAGASAVVSSQWAVSDDATRELFEAFYELRRQDSTSAAQALQQAIQRVRQNPTYQDHPSFWAPFQVMGLPT